MSLLEAYAVFGLPLILLALGGCALLFQRVARRRHAQDSARPHIDMNWRSP